jgi:hypothetical protein
MNATACTTLPPKRNVDYKRIPDPNYCAQRPWGTMGFASCTGAGMFGTPARWKP